MRVYKCDHCGKLVRWSDMYEIKMQTFLPCKPWHTKHVCKECYRSMCKWFKDPDTKELCSYFSDSNAKEECE